MESQHKLKYFILILVVAIGCQRRNHELQLDYIDLQKVLAQDSTYTKFIDLSIHTRESHYYMVDVLKPNVTLFLSYPNDLNNNDINRLVDSLARFDSKNSKTPKERADSIITRIQDALSFMEKYSLRTVTFNITSNDYYFMDFCFSRSRYLRYYHFPDTEIKSYPDDVIEAKWVDSSWVFLKTQEINSD